MVTDYGISDIILVVTASYPHRVPFGYRFILLGPILDGLMGGFSTISATNNAYISDTTPDGSRAKVFSRFGVSRVEQEGVIAKSHLAVQGILMLGFSIGPVLGTAIIKATGDM